MRFSWILVMTAGALGGGGCASPPKGLDSPVPAERLAAIAKAVKERDQSAIPGLITFLNSDDPVVRLAAFRTLELLTGQTLGYDHAAPEWKRREMIQRWVEWNNQRQTSPSSPDPSHRKGHAPGPGAPPLAAVRPGGSSADTVG